MPDGDKHDSQRSAVSAPRPDGLLACPVCGASLTSAGYEAHLRQAHRLHVFRGVRATYTETLTTLLNLLAATPPDAEAWRVLAALMREEHGARAPTVLAALLGALLTRVDDARRTAAVNRLADLVAGDCDARLTTALAADGEPPARLLALAVVARQTPPFDPALLQPLRSLLLDRRLPVEAQIAAVAALMRSAGLDSPLAAEFLRRLVSGLGKTQAVERLREFERLHGSARTIDALCAELEEQMRMSCPRCSVQLRRPAMIRHLWDEHRLILDGRRVREPWAVLDDWILEHRATGDPRCWNAAGFAACSSTPKTACTASIVCCCEPGPATPRRGATSSPRPGSATPHCARGATPWRRSRARRRRCRSTSGPAVSPPATTWWRRHRSGWLISWKSGRRTASCTEGVRAGRS